MKDDIGKGVWGWFVASAFVAGLTSWWTLFLALTGGIGALVIFAMAFLYAWFWVLLLTCLPAFILVSLTRGFGWPRPWSDVGLSACASLILSALTIASMSNADKIGAFPLIFAALGGMGGAIYWHVAGRPRPPYGPVSEPPAW